MPIHVTTSTTQSISNKTFVDLLSTTGSVYALDGNSIQWSATYATVNANSATAWNYQGTDIKALTANWQDTYTAFNIQSPNNASVYSTVNANSAAWGTGGSTIDAGVRALTSNWESTYTTVLTNSGSWGSGGSGADMEVRALTANWQSTYASVLNVSANWDSAYATVQSNSATTWNYQGTDIKGLTANWENTYTNFSVQSANNISVFSTVNSNSGTTWNYQGTDIKALTSNWQNTYTNFSTQSANNISVFSTVNANSGTWGTGGSGIDTGVRALTSNWQSTYSTVQSNSATWGTGGGGGGVPLASYNRWQLIGAATTTVYTILGATSDVEEAYRVTINAIVQDPATYTIDSSADTITFSSVPPLSSDIIVIETMIVGSNITSLTANWENTYTEFSSQSANNTSVYTTVNSNSATWGTGGGGGSTSPDDANLLIGISVFL